MENQNNILLTAFCNSSAELLIQNANRHQTLFLPNDRIKDSEKLIAAISNGAFDYVISFGQRPNIKDKVHIETTARDGDFHITTNFNYNMLKGIFEANGITCKISHNAGTSFCNQLYLNGLKYISYNSLDVKMVFVHVPFAKNIMDLERFRRQIFSAMEGIR